MSVDASVEILRWYDSAPTPLPWRTEGGERPDPYRVWLSEIMLQQTTIAAVRPYFEKFTRRWPDVDALAAADEGELMAAWAGLGYYARARNLHACARKVVSDHGGAFPAAEAELLTLPGIGRYTAAAIAAIAFGQRAVVVDGNVERVVSRLFAVEEPLPAARGTLHALTDTITPAERAGDFAQAMMDLGRSVCTPRRPRCGICPPAEMCVAYEQGRQEDFPRKQRKAAKPHREGVAYWLQHDGQVLLVRRPAKGLLGGMLALPTGQWSERPELGEGAPAGVPWEEVGSIDHVFTHFSLKLRVARGQASGRAPAGTWWPIDRLGEAGLPTVFAKAAARACGADLPLFGKAA
jgi:A/G-specific adenine glycosylase